MRKGYFRVYRSKENKQDIHFEQIELQNEESVPQEQLDLRDKVDSSLTTIRILFGQNPERFDRYFTPLLSLAQLGLVGPSANPDLANRALLSLQGEVLAREGGVIKNEYMKRLGGWAVALGTPAALLALTLPHYFDDASALVAFLYLWTGCMVGVWLSFGTRNVVITFQELGILEQDRLSPAIRLIFAGLLTMLIGLLLATKAVSLQLGDLSTDHFLTDLKVALLIGALCGISELALSAKVAQHAREFLGVK